MAHGLITLDVMATGMLAALSQKLLFTPLISRDFETDLSGHGQGDTVDIKIPGSFTARDFNHVDGISMQDMNETTTQVTLDTIKDVSFEITDTEMRQQVTSLQTQFLDPAGTALAERVNADILARLVSEATTEVGTGTTTARPWAYTTPRVLVDAKAKLNQARAPQGDRSAVIGTETAAEWSGTDLLIKANERGDTVGLREAELGRLAGFNVYETIDIEAPAPGGAAGTPTTEVSVAFHRQAIAGAFTSLEAAANTDSAVASADGLSVRVTRAYDIIHKKSIISADILYGLNAIRPEWITLIKGADN